MTTIDEAPHGPDAPYAWSPDAELIVTLYAESVRHQRTAKRLRKTAKRRGDLQVAEEVRRLGEGYRFVADMIAGRRGLIFNRPFPPR